MSIMNLEENHTSKEYFESDAHSIRPSEQGIFDAFPGFFSTKGKLPDHVCDLVSHSNNPHCEIVVDPAPPVIDTTDPSVVPLPAALWLFVAAVVALVCVAKRNLITRSTT